MAERFHRPCASRSISRAMLQGRYPGSQVLICRLPMLMHSGLMTNPHSLTVAGAAQVLHLLPV